MDPYGLPVALLVAAAGVTPETARRWKRSGRIPPTPARLVELAIAGELGVMAPAWRGFRVLGNRLWTPYQFAVSPGEICSIPWRAAQLAALELELRTPLQRDLFAEKLQPGNADSARCGCTFRERRRRRSPA